VPLFEHLLEFRSLIAREFFANGVLGYAHFLAHIIADEAIEQSGALLAFVDDVHDFAALFGGEFEFIIKGQDAPDGVASGKPDKPLKLDRDHVGIGMQGAARVQDAGALAGLSRRAGRARK